MSRDAAVLLDANVLIALTHEAHVHHAVAQRWAAGREPFRFATCVVTQLAVVRLAAMPAIGGEGASPARALALLAEVAAHPGHQYWDDAPSPLELEPMRAPTLLGHRQVTDMWLLSLAAARKSALATLDRGLLASAAAQRLERHVAWIGPAEAAHEPPPRYRRR